MPRSSGLPLGMAESMRRWAGRDLVAPALPWAARPPPPAAGTSGVGAPRGRSGSARSGVAAVAAQQPRAQLLGAGRGGRSPRLSSFSPGWRLPAVPEVLEQFLRQGRLAALICELCQQHSRPGSAERHDALLGRIVCLPDLVGNGLQGRSPAAFFPQRYFPVLGGAVLQVLHNVSASLRGEIAELARRDGSSGVFCAWTLGWCLRCR